MIPIFFHVESHLWIAYALLLNGWLAHCLFRQSSENYQRLTPNLESHVLAAFFISLLLNGGLLLALDIFGLSFSLLKWGLPVITLILLAVSFYHFSWQGLVQAASFEFSYLRIGPYCFVFIILFYNGGLIEQTSDAWWHMSLANKIGYASSFTLEHGHLSGISDRYYPPLWHGNLALLNTLSDIGIPIFWNSFTAWGGVFKVMGFYLLAWGLSGNARIGILSASLFILLPGMGDSYMRVSAWPSHIAYTALFSCIYVVFYWLDLLQKQKVSGLLQFVWDGLKTYSIGLVLIGLLLILTFTHLAEVLWLAVALVFYLTGLQVYWVFSERSIDQNDWVLRRLYGFLLAGLIIHSSCFFIGSYDAAANNIDKLLAYALPILVLMGLGATMFQALKGHRIFKFSVARWILLGIVMLLVLSVDLRHLLSLFNPDLAYPRARAPQYPLTALGWFGGDLKVPGWHLQLRGSLLYSGIVAIPLSFLLVAVRPSRLTLFLAANAVLAILFCVSPYLHQWLRDILDYHSSWRIAILIFHPIIITTAICVFYDEIVAGKEGAQH